MLVYDEDTIKKEEVKKEDKKEAKKDVQKTKNI